MTKSFYVCLMCHSSVNKCCSIKQEYMTSRWENWKCLPQNNKISKKTILNLLSFCTVPENAVQHNIFCFWTKARKQWTITFNDNFCFAINRSKVSNSLSSCSEKYWHRYNAMEFCIMNRMKKRMDVFLTWR